MTFKPKNSGFIKKSTKQDLKVVGAKIIPSVISNLILDLIPSNILSSLVLELCSSRGINTGSHALNCTAPATMRYRWSL